jgi:hypothetical protein
MIGRLIEKHRANGLLIDTNLMILLLVGRTNRRRISQFKRTQTYSIADYELLEQFAEQFQRIVTTPHVLTEVSNLAKLDGHERIRIRELLMDSIDRSQEVSQPSRVVARNKHFSRLGLTDAAISTLGSEMLVLTDDLDLWLALTNDGLDAINFNHIRALAW